jgi:hypothetical protein
MPIYAKILELVRTERYSGLRPKRTGGAPMRQTTVLRLALAVGLAASVAACQTERQNIPDLTAEAASKLPPGQLPRIFRDPTNPYGYPYNIHETDGLSRNPDDCAKWGCVDVGGGGF